MMDLQHVAPCDFDIKPENASENHDDIGHEVNGIVQDHDMPIALDRGLGL